MRLDQLVRSERSSEYVRMPVLIRTSGWLLQTVASERNRCGVVVSAPHIHVRRGLVAGREPRPPLLAPVLLAPQQQRRLRPLPATTQPDARVLLPSHGAALRPKVRREVARTPGQLQPTAVERQVPRQLPGQRHQTTVRTVSPVLRRTSQQGHPGQLIVALLTSKICYIHRVHEKTVPLYTLP